MRKSKPSLRPDCTLPDRIRPMQAFSRLIGRWTDLSRAYETASSRQEFRDYLDTGIVILPVFTAASVRSTAESLDGRCHRSLLKLSKDSTTFSNTNLPDSNHTMAGRRQCSWTRSVFLRRKLQVVDRSRNRQHTDVKSFLAHL